MSSIKRRNVDSDVPSGLLKTTKTHRVQGEDSASSGSPSPPPAAADGSEGEAEQETTKTFKDLVRVSSIE
jgi:ATP-dependent RNA helicase DDX47/RRP3